MKSFAPDPEFTDYYTSGNMELRIHTWAPVLKGEEPRVEYWLRCGICSLQLKEEDFNALLEIMDQYYDENIEEEEDGG